MENCSFILFLWLVMQGVVDNFITLLMNMIYITIRFFLFEKKHNKINYDQCKSDMKFSTRDCTRIISQCFIDNYNRLFHFDDILSKILYNFVLFKSKKVVLVKLYEIGNGKIILR
ncbi:hypothetical protein T03_12916 [Trichinella britovi]|uniref:Uncharacterized protein n=1 Tax=Trichinella britovi TaxID=45882 RepID=A0A0V1CQZ4_TRIBR|nr:hypothetical protein T03_12916 [Trichinella britovi]